MVLRMSCIYGPWQKGTEDQGWVAHFILRALRGEPLTIFGDGHQVRDILYVDDAVDAYLKAFASIDRLSGQVFNLGGGPQNAVSLRQLIAHIENSLDRKVRLSFDEWRRGDQRYFVTDMDATTAALRLAAPTPWRAGVERLVRWFSAIPVAAEATQ
jgi:CDP-paratose 2-epimerase